MSTITFLPYIGEHFIKEYIISNYVGEGLSSLVPGVLGILQGVGSISSDNCTTNLNLTNSTNTSNQTLTETLAEAPRFSVSWYFFFMFGLICLSAISFTIINFWDRMKANRKVNDESTIVVDQPTVKPDRKDDEPCSASKDKFEIGFLFCLTFLVSFVYYGYLPGIFSYSTIPFGIKYFHLATNISNTLFPILYLFMKNIFKKYKAAYVYHSRFYSRYGPMKCHFAASSSNQSFHS